MEDLTSVITMLPYFIELQIDTGQSFTFVKLEIQLNLFKSTMYSTM